MIGFFQLIKDFLIVGGGGHSYSGHPMNYENEDDLCNRAGWKMENNILKYADVDYYGTMYIKQGSIDKNRIFKILF